MTFQNRSPSALVWYTSRSVMFMKLSQLIRCPLNVSPFFSSTSYVIGCANHQPSLCARRSKVGFTIGLFCAALRSDSGSCCITLITVTNHQKIVFLPSQRRLSGVESEEHERSQRKAQMRRHPQILTLTLCQCLSAVLCSSALGLALGLVEWFRRTHDPFSSSFFLCWFTSPIFISFPEPGAHIDPKQLITLEDNDLPLHQDLPRHHSRARTSSRPQIIRST